MSTRYLVIAADTIIGLLVMPFNVHHLGQSAYGLWILTSSLNTYFTLLDLGYGGSVTRFVAQYRARRDADSINEICSTMMAVFLGVGALIYLAFIVAALNVEHLFNLSAGQVETSRILMLISGALVALSMPFGVFGGVMNAFQRYDINNFVTVGTAVVAAIVNVAMLLAGYGVVEVVFGTTLVRIAALFIYRRNAYWVFPLLSVRPTRFKAARLREVTGFSIYSAILNWSFKLNYMTDALIIGAFMSPAAVALWAVPRRVTQAVRSFTNQFNAVLMPVIVDSDTRGLAERMRTIFVHGTRLSLFGVVPGAAALFLLADPLLPAYMGPDFAASVPVAQILAVLTAFRVGNSTANVVLKGSRGIRLVAMTNLTVAVANIVLSILWIQRWGLVGQAFGTLVPVAAGTIFVLWPAACRYVGIGVGDAFRRAVWPALWPLVAMIPVVLALRSRMPANLPSVVFTAAVGALCYAATFFAFALNRADRMLMLSKLLSLAPWRRSMPAEAA